MGKILNMFILMQHSKHRLGPIFDFSEGKTTKVVEETLVWWSTKIKRAMKGLQIPKPGTQMSGDIIRAWTDAAGPSYGHVR